MMSASGASIWDRFVKGLLMFVTAAKLLHIWTNCVIGISSVMSWTHLLASSSDLYNVTSAAGGKQQAPLCLQNGLS